MSTPSTQTGDIKSQESWEEKFHELQNQYNQIENRCNIIQQKNEQIQKEKEEIQQKYEDLKHETSNNQISKVDHGNEFWQDILHKLNVGDTDQIKIMIKNKTLGLEDVDSNQMTILILASYCGCQEIVRFCINCGSDLNAKDIEGKTALFRGMPFFLFSYNRFEYI